ncbi:restriction endonuclease subunit S [Shewanella algae]|uniref:restriction endonuclease subunit S n=1 Tax=Shewanella algae TaxID=38313 RepID=UPI00399A5A90
MSKQALNRKYQAYPEYKDSGVEWLGTIPASWTVAALRHGMSDIKNGSTATQVDQGDETVPISRIETISTGKINTEKVGYVVLNNSICNYKLNIGDILFSHINSIPMVGNVAQYWSDTPLYHGMNLLRIQPSAGVDSRYLFWWLKSDFCRKSVSSLAKPAINQASIAIEQIKGLPCINPDLSEQKNIAAFLDYETARIDSLIDKQQRLIELLKEKRQAVISHAVTKGLNPDAPMKDSGVEWLGQVPEHWGVMSFATIVNSAELGGNYLGAVEDEGLPFLKMGNLGRGCVNLEKLERLPEGGEIDNKHILQSGDFLFNTRNSLDLVGKVAIWNDELAICGYNSNILRVRFHAKFVSCPAYVVLVFNTNGAIQWLRLLAKGTTSVAAIYYKDLRGMMVPVPPPEEQKKIFSYVENKTFKIDSLIHKLLKSIDLVRERRTALISAAVTGKIDLRGWTAPKEGDK